jgi:hypothetical protein
VEIWYQEKLEEHVRDVARVTGMTTTSVNGNIIAVEDTAGVSRSLIRDGSEENIMRACFMFHYAMYHAYRHLFCKDLVLCMEAPIMDRMNVEYTTTTHKELMRKGCVARLGAKTFNRTVSNMKSKITTDALITFTWKAPKGHDGIKIHKRSCTRESAFYISSPCRPGVRTVRSQRFRRG